MKLIDIKLGDKLRVTKDTSCLKKDELHEVLQDINGALFVMCQDGDHYLSQMQDHHGKVPEFELSESHNAKASPDADTGQSQS
jgi:hypothetical protein